MEELLDEAGAAELTRALELGLVDLHPMGMDLLGADDSLSDAVTGSMAALLTESVNALARTFSVVR